MTRFDNRLGARLHVRVLLLVAAAMPAAAAARGAYQQINLVTDPTSGLTAAHVDGNLINSWGIAFDSNGFACVADNGTGLATCYDGSGMPQPPVIILPSDQDNPTGIVSNNTPGFSVEGDPGCAPSQLIFATESGGVVAWAQSVDATHAFTVVDNSSKGSIYKGLALAGNGEAVFLYATDFHNARVDVFDSSFHPAHLAGAFEDPTLPAGFAPFGIQNIQGDLYVTYAEQDANKEDDVPGRGLGFVNVFDANGHLLRRLISRGQLNAPWGVALAPAGFGRFKNQLLVGNFGDGLINAYDPATGRWLGRLRSPDGHALRIDGLWGLAFGNGVHGQPADTLFFASGPGDEEHGLYGRIEATGKAGVRDEADEAPEREDEPE